MTGQPFGTQLVAGDTWTWSVSEPGYSAADGYSLKFFLRGAQTLDIVATVADDGSFLLTATPNQTSALTPGTYGWQLAVFKNTDRTELARGSIEILADLASQAAGVDSRSWVERGLSAVRAVLAGTASRVEQEYQINGRMLKLRSPAELIKLESYFGRKLRRMQIDSGQVSATSNDLRVRFGGSRCNNGSNGWHS